MQIFNGDCLELLKNIPDKSIDLICSDLPYGTTNCKWDSCIDLENLWEQYNRISKPNTAVILFAQTPFDKVLGVSNLKKLKYELIWEKSHATGHLNAKKMPMKAHENILVFYDNLPTYNPIKTEGHKRKTSVKRIDSSSVYGAQNFDELPYASTSRYPRSIVKFSSDKQTSNLHPTQKPVALMEWLVKTYSNEGDTVLDSCMGSGTTGVACIKNNRKFIGMELDQEYFSIAEKRIKMTNNLTSNLECGS